MESGVAGGSWVSTGEKGKSQVKRAKAAARTTKTTGKIVDQSPESTRPKLSIHISPPATRQSKAIRPMIMRIQKLLVRFGFCFGGRACCTFIEGVPSPTIDTAARIDARII